MNVATLAKGFVFGGLVGATFAGVRGLRHRDQGDQVLDPKPEYFKSMAPDLIPIFVDYLSYYRICPDRWKLMYQKKIQEAIQQLDHLLCIEMQLAQKEIEASVREPMEAEQWGMAAMNNLRQVVYYFLQSDYMVEKLTDKANDTLTIVALHLDNINKYTYES